MKNTLSVNQITPGTQVNGATAIGGSQPPMNIIAAIAHIVVIATYSPSMNRRYGVEPYSTMNPATSSDSASTRANGGEKRIFRIRRPAGHDDAVDRQR